MSDNVPGEPFGLRESLRLVRAHDLNPGPNPDLAGYDPLDALISVCADNVPGADAAAISHAEYDRVRSTHYTDPDITKIDRWQRDFRQGPLLDQALAPQPYRSVLIKNDLVLGDVIDGTAVEVLAPFRSLHSTTLRSDHGHRTALDLYARNPHAFGGETTVLADMFAIRAAHLLYGCEDSSDDTQRILDAAARSLRLTPGQVQTLLESHLRGGRQPLETEDRPTHGQQPPDAPPL